MKGGISPYYRCLLYIVSTLALLLLLVGYDVSLRTIPQPELFRYLAPGGVAYVATSSIDAFWRSIAVHYKKLEPDNPLQEAFDKAKDELANKCLSLSGPEDLGALGIDPSAGIALAVHRVPHGNSWIAVIPVTDPGLLRHTIATLNDKEKATLTLTAPGVGESGKIRVTRLAANDDFVLCSGGIGRVSQGTEVPTGNDHVILNFVPRTDRDVTVSIECVGVDHVGREHACGCPSDVTQENSKLDACKISLKGLENGETKETLAGGGEISSFEWRDVGHFVLVDDRTVLMGMDLALIKQNLTNLRYGSIQLASSDSLAEAQQLLVQQAVDDEDGWIAGAIDVPSPFGSGRAPFAVRIATDHMSLRAEVGIDPSGATLVAQLLEPALREPRAQPAGVVASLSTSDAGPLRVWRYLNEWVPNCCSKANEALSNFDSVLTYLDPNKLKSSRVMLLGLRDGLPDVAVAIEIPRADADEVVVDLQRHLRQQRDNLILSKASQGVPRPQRRPLTQAIPGANTECVPDPDTARAVFSKLAPEEGAQWTNYRFATPDGNGRRCGWTGDPAATVFTSGSYRFGISNLMAQYVMPPVTDNDFQFGTYSGAALMPEEKRALLDNRFRLASMYRSDTLWFGTDRGTLEVVGGSEFGISSLDVCRQDNLTRGRAKLTVCISPSLSAAQGQTNDSSTSIQKFFAAQAWWASAYRRFQIDMATNPDNGRVQIGGRLE